MARTSSCPICGRPAEPRSANRAFPFCSPRCRLIDLGKWLGDEYRIPGPPAGEGGEEPGRPVETDDDAP